MIALDLEAYWFAVGVILISLAGFWAFRRIKGLF
jgi:hypothetical protein